MARRRLGWRLARRLGRCWMARRLGLARRLGSRLGLGLGLGLAGCCCCNCCLVGSRLGLGQRWMGRRMGLGSRLGLDLALALAFENRSNSRRTRA